MSADDCGTSSASTARPLPNLPEDAAASPNDRFHLDPLDSADIQQLEARLLIERRQLDSYEGPIPPPALLEGFERVVRGSAGRLLAMAETDQAHSQRMDVWRATYAFAGLACGLASMIACVAGAVFLALHDKEVVAVGLLGLPVIGAIGWFIRARLASPSRGKPVGEER